MPIITLSLLAGCRYTALDPIEYLIDTGSAWTMLHSIDASKGVGIKVPCRACGICRHRAGLIWWLAASYHTYNTMDAYVAVTVPKCMA